jgi:hypothetical protein
MGKLCRRLSVEEKVKILEEGTSAEYDGGGGISLDAGTFYRWERDAGMLAALGENVRSREDGRTVTTPLRLSQLCSDSRLRAVG